MNYELAEKLESLLRNGNLDKAIELAENELKNTGASIFHKIIEKEDLLKNSKKLAKWISKFYKKATKQYDVKALYTEMNGFTINYDRWYCDIFAYDNYGGIDDVDWLSEWIYDNSVNNTFTLKGFEDMQKNFENYHKNQEYKNEKISASADICELLIILRLQQLFQSAKEIGLSKNEDWVRIPFLVTAHDYELILKL